MIRLIPTVFLSLCLAATACRVLTQSQAGFWVARVAFAASVLTIVVIAHRRGVLRTLIRTDWGSICLYLFLLYFGLRAASHPSPEVANYFLKAYAGSVLLGLGVGLLAFVGVDERRRQNDAFCWAWLGAGLGLATLCVIGKVYFTDLMSKYFILSLPEGVNREYQVFGNYLTLLFICIVCQIEIVGRGSKTVLGNAAYAALMGLTGILAFLLSQASGSNTAAVVVALITLGVLLPDQLGGVFAAKHYSRLGAVISICISLILLTLMWAVLATQPPLRLFGYRPIPDFPIAVSWLPPHSQQAKAGGEDTLEPEVGGEVALEPEVGDEIDSISAVTEALNNSSVNSRREIWTKYALPELQINPLFGELNADSIVTGSRGLYIHSLISIQSHLGLIGSLLMVGYLTSRMILLFRQPTLLVLKVSASVIVLMGIAATFFTWMPFWFIVGALYMPVRADPRS